jgi:hypothetical protein
MTPHQALRRAGLMAESRHTTRRRLVVNDEMSFDLPPHRGHNAVVRPPYDATARPILRT